MKPDCKFKCKNKNKCQILKELYCAKESTKDCAFYKAKEQEDKK